MSGFEWLGSAGGASAFTAEGAAGAGGTIGAGTTFTAPAISLGAETAGGTYALGTGAAGYGLTAAPAYSIGAGTTFTAPAVSLGGATAGGATSTFGTGAGTSVLSFLKDYGPTALNLVKDIGNMSAENRAAASNKAALKEQANQYFTAAGNIHRQVAKENEYKIGSVKSQLGASGFSPDEGSPLTVYLDRLQQVTLDNFNAGKDYEAAGYGAKMGAKLASSKQTGVVIGGLSSMFGTVLKGLKLG